MGRLQPYKYIATIRFKDRDVEEVVMGDTMREVAHIIKCSTSTLAKLLVVGGSTHINQRRMLSVVRMQKENPTYNYSSTRKRKHKGTSVKINPI